MLIQSPGVAVGQSVYLVDAAGIADDQHRFAVDGIALPVLGSGWGNSGATQTGFPCKVAMQSAVGV